MSSYSVEKIWDKTFEIKEIIIVIIIIIILISIKNLTHMRGRHLCHQIKITNRIEYITYKCLWNQQQNAGKTENYRNSIGNLRGRE